MNTAVSVLFPVYNAEHSLESGVTGILELLPELSPRFELCILDDGSTDDTAEIAHQLAARYPQVTVIRHPVRLGLAEAIQTGLDHTQGEIVLVGNEDYNLEPDDLRTLWQLRDTQRNRFSDTALVAEEERWMDKLAGWQPRAKVRQSGFQVIRRQVFEQFRLQQAMDMVARVDHGSRTLSMTPPAGPKFRGPTRRPAWGNHSRYSE